MDYSNVKELLAECIEMPICWQVFIQPGGVVVESEQKECLEKGFFGMGWGINSTGDGADAANRDYNRIRKGDYIITRLYDAHYYIGVVISERLENIGIGRLNSGFRVERWIDLGTDVTVPGCISGRFSIRNNSTIKRINTEDIRIFMHLLLEVGEPFDIRSKLRITKHNFISNLNANILEDVVYLYIKSLPENHEFDLVPSTCKIYRKKYEYVLVDAKGEKISCQVKNRDGIDPKKYIKDKEFKRIYMYSGMWSDEEIEEKKRLYEGYDHIDFISQDDLFAFVNEHLIKDEWCRKWKEHIYPSRYYDFSAEKQLDSMLTDWRIGKARKNRACPNETYYKNNGNYILYYQGNAYTYYPRWDRAVLYKYGE